MNNFNKLHKNFTADIIHTQCLLLEIYNYILNGQTVHENQELQFILKDLLENAMIEKDYKKLITSIYIELRDFQKISKATKNEIFLVLNELQERYNTNIFNSYTFLNVHYLKEYLIHKYSLLEECENCGLTHWQNEKLPLKLNFKDGNIYNQHLNNIQLLCPNCFSQIGYTNYE